MSIVIFPATVSRTNSVHQAADHLLALFVDPQKQAIVHDVALGKELAVRFDRLL